MDNNSLLYLLLGASVLFLGAIIIGISPSLSLPIPYTTDYLLFVGEQVANDAINAAISGILGLPLWVLASIFAVLIILGIGYSTDSDLAIYPVTDGDSSSPTAESDWIALGARSVVLAVNEAVKGIIAIGHATAVIISEAGKRINKSNVVSIDFALAQITGISVSVGGLLRGLFGDDTDGDE